MRTTNRIMRTTDRIMRTTDRVVRTTNRIMRTTDRVVRRTDWENDKLRVHLWSAKYQEEMYENATANDANKEWEISEKDNDMIQLIKIILNKQRATVWFHVHSFVWFKAFLFCSFFLFWVYQNLTILKLTHNCVTLNFINYNTCYYSLCFPRMCYKQLLIFRPSSS